MHGQQNIKRLTYNFQKTPNKMALGFHISVLRKASLYQRNSCNEYFSSADLQISCHDVFCPQKCGRRYKTELLFLCQRLDGLAVDTFL